MRNDIWWCGYTDGFNDDTPKDTIMQEWYDEGYYAGQMDRANTRNR